MGGPAWNHNAEVGIFRNGGRGRDQLLRSRGWGGGESGADQDAGSASLGWEDASRGWRGRSCREDVCIGGARERKMPREEASVSKSSSEGMFP